MRSGQFERRYRRPRESPVVDPRPQRVKYLGSLTLEGDLARAANPADQHHQRGQREELRAAVRNARENGVRGELTLHHHERAAIHPTAIHPANAPSGSGTLMVG